MDAASLAQQFLSTFPNYPPETFHAILIWDLFDYAESELLTQLVARMYELLRPGGAVLAVFHNRPPERFNRYRIVDFQSVELLPAPALFPHLRIFQNRELMNQFGQFRSSKTFVGRDQLREGLFLK